MKIRGSLNYVIDILMLIALGFIAGVGFLMKYTLPPGREQILKYGGNTNLSFLGLDRHEWGSLHLMVAYLMLGLLVLHIVLHWKLIVCLARNFVPGRTLRWTLGSVLVLLIAGLVVFGFVITPTRADREDYLHRNIRGGDLGNQILPEQTDRGDFPMPAEQERLFSEEGIAVAKEPVRDGQGKGAHMSILGSMTLAEVAGVHGLSVDEVKRRLGLPDHISGQEQMGRLRRLYGFTMSQVEERLKKGR